MERIYNKLVRDNIPNVIRSNGETAIIRVLNEEEYKKELEAKLYEEYEEVICASGYDRCEELADMLEVLRALANLENKTLDDILLIAEDKKQKRGAFTKRIYLEKVINNVL